MLEEDKNRLEAIRQCRASGMTQQAIGAKLGISGGRVGQILKRAAEDEQRQRDREERIKRYLEILGAKRLDAARTCPSHLDSRYHALIGDGEFGSRAHNALHNAGIEYAWQLAETPREALFALPNVGRETMKEFDAFLAHIKSLPLEQPSEQPVKLRFTQDWFHWAPEVWEQITPTLPARRSFLEIGSFEGRSTAWTVANMLEDGGCITCVDTWKGGEEHIVVAEDMGSVEERFEWNMREVNSCYPLREIRKAKGTSYEFLASFIASKEQFDFVYIDGSHIAKDVLTDACMVWPLVKVGGIVVFDDYLWGEPRDVLHRPKLAVDTFVNLFAEEVHMMHLGYQFIVKRVA